MIDKIFKNKNEKGIKFNCIIELTDDSPTNVWNGKEHYVTLLLTKDIIVEVSKLYIIIIKDQLMKMYGCIKKDLINDFNIRLKDVLYDVVEKDVKKYFNFNEYDTIKSIKSNEEYILNHLENLIIKSVLKIK